MLQITAELARPIKDPETLAAQGKWLPPAELVQMLTTAQEQAQADWQKPAASVVAVARAVHDAVLSAAVITHLPPGRISCLRSMLAPDSPSPCTHADCKMAGCEGNRLYILSKSPLKMRMQFPHHKNARRWRRAEICFDVPPELADMLLLYLEGPRKTLLQHCIQETCEFVFMDSQCRAFNSSTFCLHWQAWMRSLGGPPLNPTTCRQIFVTERQSDTAAPGPSDRGAAMVMGHSTRQWNDWYDVKFHAKLAQHAVDAMQAWRTAMLQGAGPALQSAAANNDAALTAATARSHAVADAAVMQDAVENAAAVDAAITTEADLPAAKRRRFVIWSDSDSDSDSQPQPAVQHAACQPAQLTEPTSQQAELEGDVSDFMSCYSGSDSEIELDLEVL